MQQHSTAMPFGSPKVNGALSGALGTEPKVDHARGVDHLSARRERNNPAGMDLGVENARVRSVYDRIAFGDEQRAASRGLADLREALDAEAEEQQEASA